MSRVVYLHIGAPKTGTTYLQDRLTLNAESLAAHGVHFPTRSPLVSPGLFHFRAALDLLGQDWGGAPGHAEGSWDALVRRVRRRSGTVDHQPRDPRAGPARASGPGDGRPRRQRDPRRLLRPRPRPRQLPAAWQESIKQGRKWSYRKFLRRCQRGKPWFVRAFDLPAVLGDVGRRPAARPDARRHRPAAPGADATGGDPLWLRFCEAFGIDPAWAPRDSDRDQPLARRRRDPLIRAAQPPARPADRGARRRTTP